MPACEGFIISSEIVTTAHVAYIYLFQLHGCSFKNKCLLTYKFGINATFTCYTADIRFRETTEVEQHKKL